MSQNIPVDFNTSLEKLKAALLSLKATGKDGFEGILRLALTKLTGIQFRLAASGLQGGFDGDSALPNDGVSFEAKRYADKIDRETVLTKLVDLARRESTADRLWVLGATTEVSAQLAEAIRQAGDQHDISTFILDWIPLPIPLLSVAIVFSGEEAIDFLITHFDEKSLQKKISRDELSSLFKSISAHPGYANCLHSLRENLNISKLAFSRAINLNTQWRQETFSSAPLARERFGQALAVVNTSNFPVMRTAIRMHLTSELQAGNCMILSGDEGHGKSWLAAQICAEMDGMAIFISAEQFDGVTIDKLDEFLISILINQTGDIADETLKSRWRHRFKAWKTTPLSTSLLVVVDGINQRQSTRWDRLINGIYSKLREIGGCLIVTVRPEFWKKEVANGLSFVPKIIDVPVWQPKERNEILKYYKISLDWLDINTLKTLQNPRLLSVAIATLPPQQAVAWKGLTTDRLLMEHLRASQLENFENETFISLTNRLSEHAAQVLRHVQVSPNEPPPDFKSDSKAVIETRFFHPIAGPGDLYELRDDGIILALGFTLVDQLWQTQRAKRDLVERIVQLVEPIKAMDRTSDVLFAGLLVCALDNIRFDNAIFASLLDAFSNLQNVNDRRFEEFVEIVRHQPSVFFDVLKMFCLEKWRRVNYDWFIHAAHEVVATQQGWKAAELALHHWLHCYNADAEEQFARFPVSSSNHSDNERRFKELKDDIDEVLANLSPYEKQLLEHMVTVSGDLDSLFTLALQLIAGRPLANFADSFISMGLAFALDTHMPSARKAFQQLTNFNRVDRLESKKSFILAIAPLRDSLTSRSGQWTIVRMLHATGDEDAAIEAIAIADRLQEDNYNFEFQIDSSWRDIKLANPDAERTIEIDNGLDQFCNIDPKKMMLSRVRGSEEYNYQDLLPLACRFEPKLAYEKTRCLLSTLLIRTGFPLRQAILNCEKHIPLVDSNFAYQLAKKFKENVIVNTLPERDKTVCQMFIYSYIANKLSAEEQLNCMRDKVFGESYLFSVIPSFKYQPTEDIVKALKTTLEDKDEDAAYLIIIAALYGDTHVTPELEELILYCCNGDTSKLRSAAYEFAVDKNLNIVRRLHVKSSWSAQHADDESHEGWFGSILLMEAFANDEIVIEDLFKRIDKRTWFFAIHRLGDRITERLTDNFINQLHVSIKNIDKISLPTADFTISEENRVSYPLISIDETNRNGGRFKEEKNLKELFLDFSNPDNFYEKRDRLRVVMETFLRELKVTDLEYLTQNITLENISSLVKVRPEFLFDLIEIIEKACDSLFIWLRNLAFIVANLISDNFPERAVAIFERAITSQSFLTLSYGDGLTLEHRAVWASQESKPIKELWRKRLMSSGNDEILFREVLAAERFGASSFIKLLINELAMSQDSLYQAYAITIAGYSERYMEFISLIEKHTDDKALSGDAARHALIANENARWGQYWIDKMWDASTSEEFWRYLMISETCIDSRISNKPKINTHWKCYTSVFQRVRQTAIKNHNKERVKKFLGQEVPQKFFVI